MLHRTLLFLLPLFLSTTALAQRDLKDIPPPDPELERETFVLPEGFEVNLFAADPQIAKPIQMNFDPQGRLWICSSSTYPQVAPGDEADDRVLVLEDADGDGVSDTTTVFAGGLLIPTGIAPGDGGAYVANSTELLHLVDTDGDGHADSRRVILSGFGTEDTHHILHTFRWGPEQRLYMLQSIYIHSHVETPWGVQRLNAGGIWRFRPETWDLSVFARGWVNAWGLHFLPFGQTFVTDGAGGEGINYAVPGASYVTAYGAERILPGLNPGSPKHCGLEVVTGRHLPEDWQNSLITNDFRGHRVCRFTLSEHGSGFVSQEQQEVIKSDHVAFRPIDVKMGPDGAIYIADWYNPIIQHGEVDFRDPRRDHTHGRIWRVTYTGNPLVERPNLVDASDAELCEQLAAPEMWTREQAKRLLKERGPKVLPAVRNWAVSLDNSLTDYHQLRLEALWVYLAHSTERSDGNAKDATEPIVIDILEGEQIQMLRQSVDLNELSKRLKLIGDADAKIVIRGHRNPKYAVVKEVLELCHRLNFSNVQMLNVEESDQDLQGLRQPAFEEELLESLLRCHDHNARAAATRVIGDWHQRLDDVYGLLEPLVRDEHPRVRLEAVCVLRDIRKPRSIELAMRAINPEPDPRSARDAWSLSDPDLAESVPPVQVDQWLEYALWQTCRDLQPVWQPALLAGDIDFGGDVRQLAFLLRSAGSAETVPVLTRLLSEGSVPRDEQPDAVAVIGQYAGPQQLDELLQLATTTDDPDLPVICLQTLLQVSGQRKVQPSDVATPLGTLFRSDDDRVRALAARCIGAWKVASLRSQLESLIANDAAGDEVRTASISGIAAFGGEAAGDLLAEVAASNQQRNLRQAAVIALLDVRRSVGIEQALSLIREPEKAESLTPLFEVFLSDKEALAELTTALDGASLPADVAVVGLRAIGSSGQQLPELSAALQKSGGITSGPKALSPEEMQAMMADVDAHGDPAAGEIVFRRQELNCLKCHAIGGAGGKVGPDMISLGATAQLDYIIDALLDPNKQVKENYHTTIVIDDDGKTYSGILVRQTGDELLLRDAEGREQAIPLDSIDEREQGVSLMPAGLIDKLTHQELIDLVAFLKALGRLPDYTIGTALVSREWEVLQPTDAAAHQLRRISHGAAATDDAAFTWLSKFTSVAGLLPLGELPPVVGTDPGTSHRRGIAFVRMHIDSDGSPIKLRFNDTAGLTAWWDEMPLELTEEVEIPSEAGRHRLTLAVDRGSRTKGIRVERAVAE